MDHGSIAKVVRNSPAGEAETSPAHLIAQDAQKGAQERFNMLGGMGFCLRMKKRGFCGLLFCPKKGLQTKKLWYII
jgi:hypothetical protein